MARSREGRPGFRTCRRARGVLGGPDPDDRRAKLIVLTDRGYDAVQAAFDTIIEIEAQLEEALGLDGLLQLRTALRKIAEIPPPPPGIPASAKDRRSHPKRGVS
jgi:hypothetical protein